MKAWMGFAISCVLIPAVYAGLAYWYVAQYGGVSQKNDPLTLAFLIALPLVVGGFPKWWDVWILTPPKIGSPWRACSPTDFVAEALKWHTIAIVVCAVIHLILNQNLEEKFSETKLTLDVPQAKARLSQIGPELADANRRLLEARLKLNDSGPAGFFSDEERRVAGLDVNRLTQERESILSQLAEHERKASFLKAKSQVPGDHFVSYALAALWISAIGYSLHSPVEKRFHSGQPIRRG